MASVIVCYLCWLFGGIIGLHLVYLNRNGEARVYALSLGGFIWCWLIDFVQIPSYCRMNAGETLELLAVERKYNKRPNIGKGFGFLFWCYSMANICLLLSRSAILPSYSDWMPFMVQLGMESMGICVGVYIGFSFCLSSYARGYFSVMLLGTWAFSMVQVYVFPANVQPDVFCLSSNYAILVCIALLYGTREWTFKDEDDIQKLRIGDNSTFFGRLGRHTMFVTVVVALGIHGLYQHGAIQVNNEQSKVFETLDIKTVVNNVLQSDFFGQIKESMAKSFQYDNKEGFRFEWQSFQASMDQNGHRRARRTLGLKDSGASLSEIKRAYKVLVLKYHPDKISGDFATDELRNKKFIEIQEAYETLTSRRED